VEARRGGRSCRAEALRFDCGNVAPRRRGNGRRALDARGSRTDIPALPFCRVTLRGQKPPQPGYPRAIRTLGDQLKKRRLDLGMTQGQLAQEFGVDPTTIANWEHSRTTPAPNLVEAVAQFLGGEQPQESSTVREVPVGPAAPSPSDF
jgi:DNA-binding XRE family transcriptional regulator